MNEERPNPPQGGKAKTDEQGDTLITWETVLIAPEEAERYVVEFFDGRRDKEKAAQ